jgi:protein involved in polysaccharide export with SLBB domain
VLTVSQAIIAAQGLKTTARSGKVLIIRTDTNNDREVRSVDVASVLEGEAASQDVQLQARDIVYVPRSTIAEVNTFVEQYIRNVLPISPSVAFVPPL